MSGIEIGVRPTGRPRKLSDDDCRRLGRDYSEGLAIDVICERYKIGRMTLYRVLRRLQVESGQDLAAERASGGA